VIIIGADYHPGFQQIAFVDTDSGEFQERRLQHREEAEKFYRDLAAQAMRVRVGMEASGQARWFERLLSELHFELWIGDAADIRTRRVRKQKTDRQDAQLILQLAAGRSLPEDLGTELGEPGSAATAVAPAPHGAGAHADHEPAASRGAQRRPAL
jgi:transposase